MKKLLLAIIYIFIFNTPAIALVEVDITRGNLSPLPIAVSPLSIDKKSKESFNKILKNNDLGSEISIVVENNLNNQVYLTP